MKRTLLTIISFCAITFSAIAQKPAPGTESVNEFLILLINQKVDVSIKNQTVSPKGNIILHLNENTSFAEDATITINGSQMKDLAEGVQQLITVMKISSKHQDKRIKTITINDTKKIPVTYEKKPVSDKEPFDVDMKDGRTFLLCDFKQATKYPELVDDDFANGDFDYMFYKKDDFVTVTISGVVDEDKIKSALEEFKSVMKKREIEQYLVVNIYEKKTPISESRSSSLVNLIKTMEIKDF